MNRLIYKSRSAAPITWESIEAISSVSQVNNDLTGVTGVLLASRSHFLQVLEGRFEDVNAAFRRIAKDDRHTALSIISFVTIDARLFANWGMRGLGTFDLNIKLESELKRIYGEEEGGIHFPLEEWKALSLIHSIKMTQELPEWKR